MSIATLFEWTLRGLLSMVLVATALLKFISPWTDSYVLPASLYYGSAVLEAVIAIGLLSPYVRATCKVLLAFLVLAIIAAALRPVGGKCGCLGDLTVPRSAQLMMIATIGISASLLLKLVADWQRENEASATGAG